ncbi:MAG: transketolase family protein [Clostridia bacterium]
MAAEYASTRSAFIAALIEAGRFNTGIVVVSADSESRFGGFVKEFPNRSFNVGIAEQTMVGMAAGLALTGKTPVITAYANFLAFRALEQIRVDIAAEKLDVKIVGTDTGFSAGWSGYTHLALEDMAAIRALPNIVIMDPADGNEAFHATRAMFEHRGPVYIRLRGRQGEPALPVADRPFVIGQGEVLVEGEDVLIVACGAAVYHSLEAARLLREQGWSPSVVKMSTVRPLDEGLLGELAARIPKVVTVEEHSIVGGLGSAVAEFLCERGIGAHLRRLGVVNGFCRPGSEKALRKALSLDSEGIASAVSRFLINEK